MPETLRRVRPTPTNAYLANPHRGCCTFQHFNGDDLYPGNTWSEEGPITFPKRKFSGVAPGYLPTTVSYCRWFWEIFEPEEGRYDFSVIEKSIETAKARGQTLAIRLMAFGSAGQPQVPAWYAKKYPTVSVTSGQFTDARPVHDSPEYLYKFGALIRACGARFDGHPLIETMDVGYIGPWGEGDGEMSVAQMRRFNDVHKEAFSKTARLIEVCDEQGKVGIESGAGWRWNCYGDMGDAGSSHVLKVNSWNHMYDAYPNAVHHARAQERWKTQPVHFETCGVPMDWYDRGYDIDFILQQGLKYHPTYFMPKSTALPAAWMDKLADFCNHIGYRFVLRQAIVPTEITARGAIKIHLWVENVGVAPLYRPYELALRVRQGERDTLLTVPAADPRTWLPGDTIIEATLNATDSIKPGPAELALGLLDPATREARVSFAVKEVFSDRWVALGPVMVGA